MKHPRVGLCDDGISIRWENAVIDIGDDGISYAVRDGDAFRAGTHDITLGDGGVSLAQAIGELRAYILRDAEPLGHEFLRVWDENLERLYEP